MQRTAKASSTSAREQGAAKRSANGTDKDIEAVDVPEPTQADPRLWKERKRWVTIALWAGSYFGCLGLHWFYDGRKSEGVIHLILSTVLIYLVSHSNGMNSFGIIIAFWVIFLLKCLFVDLIRIGNRPKVYYINKQLPGQYFENKP